MYVVAGYEQWLDNSIDDKLKYLHREIQTQHQWRFEAVDLSVQFPFGVKTTFRAYSSSKVVEFEKKDKRVAMTPIGQETGLDPYTLYCTWQPEAYGANSQVDRQGIEGTYILSNIPDGKIPVLDFVDQSQHYVTQFMKRIRQTYEYGGDIRVEWDEWYESIAPRLLPDADKIDTVVESAASYVIRLGLSDNEDVRKLVVSPMTRLLSSKVLKNNNQYWKISTTKEEVYDLTFTWPEQLKAAMNSVQTSLNKNPHAPRLSAVADQQLLEWRETFSTSTEPFFDRVNESSTKDDIVAMVRRYISYSGEGMSYSSLNKSQLVTKMKSWSRAFFVSVFRPVNDSMQSLFSHTKDKLLSAHEAVEVATKIGEHVLTKKDIQTFLKTSYNEVEKNVFDAFISMFAKRSTRICQSYQDVNSSSQYYKPRTRSLFFPSKFFEDVETLVTNRTDICSILIEGQQFDKTKYYRFYFTVNLSEYMTGIVVLDFSKEKFYLLCPHLDNNSNREAYVVVFNPHIQSVVKYLDALLGFNFGTYEVEIFPFQYFNFNQSDCPAQLEILLLLYFLEVEVPIWYHRELQLPVMKYNFCLYLLNGEFPS